LAALFNLIENCKITMPKAKVLIVNTLARGGGTMIERLLDSQEDIICMPGFLQIPQMVAQALGYSALQDIAFFDMEDSAFDPHMVETSRLRNQMLRTIGSYLEVFASSRAYDLPEGNISERRVHGLELTDLLDLSRYLLCCTNVDGLLDHWNEFTNSTGASVVGSKWTLCHRYAPVHLQHANGYWIELLRDPYDRYVSAKLSHRLSVARSIQESSDQFRFAKSFSHPRYRVIRYEDLCNRTSETLAELSEWLGVPVGDRELINPYGGPFRANSSENEAKGQWHFSQNSSYQPKIGAVDGGWRAAHLTSLEEATITSGTAFSGFYPPRKVPRIRSGLAAANLSAYRVGQALRATLRFSRSGSKPV